MFSLKPKSKLNSEIKYHVYLTINNNYMVVPSLIPTLGFWAWFSLAHLVWISQLLKNKLN